ncbi:MAG: DUF5666 domain-containing protein [Nitrosomonas sp.]|nr:DUF5666 domain-containing protein [Nitrosomonas sp.]
MASEGGIGGTGAKLASEGGIGGTGDKLTEDGGIGGTGIIGVITGFASICVNGIEVHYDSSTSVSMDGSPSTLRDLIAGQIVVVRAEGSGDEVNASHIAIMHAAVGPVTHIDHASREIQVVNQSIQLQVQQTTERLAMGEWVRVSGHRLANGTIIASQIQSISPIEHAIINGTISRIGGNEIVVDGTRIELDPHTHLTGLSEGTEVSVTGNWNGAGIQAQTVQVDPTWHSLGNVSRVVMEGYVQAVNDQALLLNNQKIRVIPDAQIVGADHEKLQMNQRIQVRGRITPDNQVVADKVELKSEPFVQDINGVYNDSSSPHARDSAQRTEDSRRNDDEQEKTRQNDQNDQRDHDSDTKSGKSEDSSAQRESEKFGGSPARMERENAREQPVRRLDDDRDGKGDDREGRTRDVEQLERKDDAVSIDSGHDLDRDSDSDHDFDRDGGRDVDRSAVEDSDLKFDREQDFDLDRNQDRDIDRDLDREIRENFDRDIDRDIDRDFDRDVDRDIDRDIDRDFHRGSNSDFDR